MRNNVKSKLKDNDNSFEAIEKENNNHLKEFEEFLEKRNYREKVIEEHISRVDYYINYFLMLGVPKHMEKGCSFDAVNFINDKVNSNVIPPSVHNIDFFLGSIRLFYECMLERKYISKKVFNEFVRDIKECKDEMVEDYYEKNPKEIDIYDVIEAIEMAHGYGEGYININSKETVFLPEDEGLIDEDIEELCYKVEGQYWIKVPEIDDYAIMTNFAHNQKSKAKAEKLLDILHNKKAYRNFKDEIYKMKIEEKYYDYYDSVVAECAQNWLDENLEPNDYEDYDNVDDDFS